MWNRKDLKANAREAFKANYWPCVLIPFIPVAVGMLLGLLMTVKMFSNVNELVDAAQSATDGDYLSYYFKIFGSMSSMISISSLLSIFVLNPLSVGIARFFLVNSYTPAEVGEVTDGFKGGKYLKSVGTLFLMGLAISAGLFLFYIPGFILMYSYRLVPFILADDPDVSSFDALKRSRQLMKGNKWKSFVLDLSFIGWLILSVFTFGLLSIFWTLPYIYATEAELYRAIIEINTPSAPNAYNGQPDYYGGQPYQNVSPMQNAYQHPVNEQPVQDQYQQPVNEQPVQDQYRQPVNEQPVQDQYRQPVTEQPVQNDYQQPVNEQPMQNEYVQPDPVADAAGSTQDPSDTNASYTDTTDTDNNGEA